MKRILVLLLAIGLLSVSFSGCGKAKGPDVWDGSIAQSFASGDGSEKKPYIIEKASQFALLAQEVNSGTDYKGKSFSLASDLNLNHCEWTPIGNGTHSFNGIFDGNNHTISNINITGGANFTTENSGGENHQYTTGLFGSCCNATVKNITIDKASVTIQNIAEASTIYGGILIGTMRSDSNAEVSGIRIEEATVTCAFTLERSYTNQSIGGIIGYLFGSDDSSIVLKDIETNTNISIENGKASYNLVGGIVGTAFTQNLFDVSNCASYLSIKVDVENSYVQDNYFGAFGSAMGKNQVVSISNIYSKVTINKIYDVSHGYEAYHANAMIGEINHAKQKDGTTGYEFKNLFGYVEQIDASTGETAKSTQLYDPSDPIIYTETNCLGCETLPINHGLDTSVWDLTDLAKPKMKRN